MARKFCKFDDSTWNRIREGYARDFAADPEDFKVKIGWQQIAIYVMVGGGLIGRSFAEQPYGAYVDSRTSKRPYAMREIEQMQKLLVLMAEVAGCDPQAVGYRGKPSLPLMPNFHCAGVF